MPAGRPSAVLALTRAFAAVPTHSVPLTEDERSDLQGKVCALTDEMKQTGAPPERVIIKIRTLARAAGLDGFADALVGDAVRWSLDRYFPAENAT